MTNLINYSELTNYDLYQLERFGDILPTVQATPEGELYETGIEELNRMSEWIEMQAEQQLIEQEKMHDWL